MTDQWMDLKVALHLLVEHLAMGDLADRHHLVETIKAASAILMSKYLES